MRRVLFLFLLAGILENNGRLYAQRRPIPLEDTPTHLIRIYEDNDVINMWGRWTDNAYTNGTRVDYFYTPARPSPSFIDPLLPHAGAGSIDVYGWGLMQLMVTPDDISDTAYEPDDYTYSAALIATHTLYSYNPIKKYDFQTELVLGVLGPAAGGRQVQSLMHRAINYIQPMGWNQQFRNAALVNVNFTAEKQLAGNGSTIELIGGARLSGGTMLNSVGLYPLLRVGKLSPYFNGFFSQYTKPRANGRPVKKWRFYGILKPGIRMVFSNALYQGKLFSKNPRLQMGDPASKTPAARSDTSSNDNQDAITDHGLQRWVCSIDYGAVATLGNFSISFTQSSSSAMLKGLYPHTIGNISFYLAW